VVGAVALTGCRGECWHQRDTSYPDGSYVVERAHDEQLVGALMEITDTDVLITYERDGVTYIAHYRRP